MTTSPIFRGSFRLLFFLNRSKARPDGTSPILLRITINGRQQAMTIHRHVHPDDWDAAAGRVRGRSDESQVINRHMEVLRIRAYDRYNELLLYKEEVTPSMLKDAILSI